MVMCSARDALENRPTWELRIIVKPRPRIAIATSTSSSVNPRWRGRARGSFLFSLAELFVLAHRRKLDVAALDPGATGERADQDGEARVVAALPLQVDRARSVTPPGQKYTYARPSVMGVSSCSVCTETSRTPAPSRRPASPPSGSGAP